MKTRLLSAIRNDRRFTIERRLDQPKFKFSGWWYMLDTKTNRMVRHKRLENILHEYIKFYKVKMFFKWVITMAAAGLVILAVLGLTGCQKKTISPKSEPIKTVNNLHIYRAYGLNKSDTAEIYLNGKQLQDPFYGHNVEMNAGDTLTFYYSSASNPKIDFAIWKNDNKLPEVRYFYPLFRNAIHHIVYFYDVPDTLEPGRSRRDSIIVYRNNWYIQGKIIVN